MQPLLPEGPRPPALGLRARVRTFLTATWPGRILAAALAVWLLDAVASLAGMGLPEVVGAPARLVLSLFAVWLAWRGFRWVSAHLLWRIRTKLIVSYLFIALVPVVLLTLFMAAAIVLLLGLTASRVVTGEIDRAGDVLRSTARSALAGLPAEDGEAARALRARLAPAREVHAAVSWTLLRAGRVAASSGDAPRALPAWWKGPGFAGLVRLHPEEKLSLEALRAAWSEGDSALVLDAPADEAFYSDLERRTGIHVLQRSEMEVQPANAPRHATGGTGITFEEDGQRVTTRPGSWFLFVALPEKTELDERRQERVRRDADRVPVRSTVPRAPAVAHPAPARREREERARPPDLRDRDRRPRLHRHVRGGARPGPPPRPLDHARRPRAHRRDAEAARRATSTTRSTSARATSSASWPSPST